MVKPDWNNVVEVVIVQITNQDAEVARTAMASLSDLLLQEPATRPIAVGYLADSDDDRIRVGVTSALSRVADDAGVAAALAAAMLHDDNTEVRQQAANALGRALEHPGVMGALIAAAADPSEQVRASVATSLREKRDDPEVRRALLLLVGDEHPSVISAAMLAYYGTGGPPLSTPEDAATSEVRGTAVAEVRAAIESLLSVMDDLLEADSSQVETGFLNDLKIDLSRLDDLVSRADARDEFQVAVSRLEQLQRSFLGIANARAEVIQIANAIGAVVNIARALF